MSGNAAPPVHLVNGVRRFREQVYPGMTDLFSTLREGQAPQVLFITCSDSRVDPSLITQTSPGELFIIRNAGNLIPPAGVNDTGEVATLEYAVVALGVQHIVVCGHSGCGAMSGLLNPSSLAQLPKVRRWLRHAETTRQLVSLDNTPAGDAERLQLAVHCNVRAQLDQLRSHHFVAERERAGALQLHGWVYDIGAGEVTAYNPETRAFEPLMRRQMAS
ncbi:MAG: carbonic anhydrase [Alphaproteobacteria bacterium]|nr:carbonic anhydrase [Alphaproteobacteria bacterium]